MTLSQTGWEPQPCQCPRPRVHEFGEANLHYLIQRRLEKGPECRTWSSEWEMDLLQGLVRSPVGLGQHFLSLLAVGCRIPNDILKSYWWGWPLMMWLLRHFRFINEMVQSLIRDVPATDPGLGNECVVASWAPPSGRLARNVSSFPMAGWSCIIYMCHTFFIQPSVEGH